jgi:hypothetical protein
LREQRLSWSRVRATYWLREKNEELLLGAFSTGD